MKMSAFEAVGTQRDGYRGWHSCFLVLSKGGSVGRSCDWGGRKEKFLVKYGGGKWTVSVPAPPNMVHVLGDGGRGRDRGGVSCVAIQWLKVSGYPVRAMNGVFGNKSKHTRYPVDAVLGKEVKGGVYLKDEMCCNCRTDGMNRSFDR